MDYKDIAIICYSQSPTPSAAAKAQAMAECYGARLSIFYLVEDTYSYEPVISIGEQINASDSFKTFLIAGERLGVPFYDQWLVQLSRKQALVKKLQEFVSGLLILEESSMDSDAMNSLQRMITEHTNCDSLLVSRASLPTHH